MKITLFDHFTLTLFTNDPILAREADAAGVDRVGLDLETIGKNERQGHLNTWISNHTEPDLPALRTNLIRSDLFTRCNPPHAGLSREIDRLVGLGVKVVMLPYFHDLAGVHAFIDAVAGRARVVLLIETASSARLTSRICRIPGVDEIHFGLNDLRLSLGRPTHFHVLISDELAGWCNEVHDAGLPCAVGGIGRAGDNDLPIPSDLVYAQLARLGATGSLISRAFFRAWNHDFCKEIELARNCLKHYTTMTPIRLEGMRQRLKQCLEK